MVKKLIRSVAVTSLCVAALPCGAALSLPEAVTACREMQDESERLACYDREADRLADAQATSAAAAAAAEADADAADQATATAGAAPATTRPAERFGYRGGVLQRAVADKQKEEEKKAIPELFATAKAVSTREGGTLVVTLDNGQVWAQKAPQASFRVKVGDQIKIEPGALGSFLMTAGTSKRTTRVTRLR